VRGTFSCGHLIRNMILWLWEGVWKRTRGGKPGVASKGKVVDMERKTRDDGGITAQTKEEDL